jgi:hypothetical protein
MLSVQQIATTTEQNRGPACDQCLSAATRSDTVFQIDDPRQQLVKMGMATREWGTCSQCGTQGIVNRFSTSPPGSPSLGSQPPGSLKGTEPNTEEYLEAIAAQLNAAARNIVTQGQINERIVSRLLNLEANFKQLDRKMQTLISTGGLGRQLSVYVGDNTVLTRVLGRFSMLVDTSDLCAVSSLITSGHLDMATTDYLDGALDQGMTVVEVGAGMGYYTLIMAAGVGPTGRVYASESSAKNLELLKKNLDANGLSARFGYDVQTHAAKKPNAKVLDALRERPADLVKVGASAFTAETLRTLKVIASKSPAVQCVVDFSKNVLQDTGIEAEALFAAIRHAGFAAKRLGLRGTFDPAWDGLSVPSATTTSIVLTKI